MQTVYHLADLSRDQRADAASFNPVVSSKSSFEDALNSASRVLDKNKAKRKLSKVIRNCAYRILIKRLSFALPVYPLSLVCASTHIADPLNSVCPILPFEP